MRREREGKCVRLTETARRRAAAPRVPEATDRQSTESVGRYLLGRSLERSVHTTAISASASTKRNGGDNKIPKGSNGDAFESRTAGADAVVEVEKGPKSWMPWVYEKTESQNGLIREAVGSGRGV
ncbi:hypothetical protein E4U58_000325 [Claviceps cyperi]|nr:hypothetical protein E4U58_000325 [Claviceps cyperi]